VTVEQEAAALLHDVVEDTEVTIEQVEETFGHKIAELVGWLTDVSKPSDGKRAVRKEIDILKHFHLLGSREQENRI